MCVLLDFQRTDEGADLMLMWCDKMCVVEPRPRIAVPMKMSTAMPTERERANNDVMR